jgi:hypothetical protein
MLILSKVENVPVRTELMIETWKIAAAWLMAPI